MTTAEELLHNCLYFTANTLARIITQLAEDEFRITGISPTHAFLIMLVNHKQGISQKELSKQLHLAPSTVTRFIDKLESKDLVIRKSDGKNSFISSTEKGKKLQIEIDQAWEKLYHRYSAILGAKEGKSLTKLIDETCIKLSEEK